MSTNQRCCLWGESLAHFFRRTRLGRAIVFISLPLGIIWLAMWKPEYQPPIFDAQVHYNENSWHKVSVNAVLNTAEEINVPWLLVGSTPNEGTWRLQRADPQRVIPMLIPYDTPEARETWFQDEASIPFMEQAISQGGYRGIGEFHLFDGQVQTPVVKRMLELAAEHSLVLHARSDPNAIRQLFALQPRATILWAHAGMFTQPETIQALLDEYPNLWVDISLRGDVAPNGSLKEEWRQLLLRYPRRFVLGSGTYNVKYWYQFRYQISNYRDWLAEMPSGVAENIAFRNGLDLFSLSSDAAIRSVGN